MIKKGKEIWRMIEIIPNNIKISEGDNKEQIKGLLLDWEMSLCSWSTKARTHSKWKIHSEKLTLYNLTSMDYKL